MGINIDEGGSITVDFEHELLVDTSLERNPTKWREDGFQVLSIFQRKRSTDNRSDGNPVVHAIKGHRYKISSRELARLSRRATHIARRLGNRISVDAIIIAPSKHPLNRYMASRLRRHVFPRAQIFECLEKRTIRDVIASIKSSPMTPQKRRAAGRLLATLERTTRPDEHIQMKLVDKALAEFVHPVKFKGGVDAPEPGANILLVEDIYSSGQTIRSCVTELRASCDPNEIVVLTMFSPLPRLRRG